MGSCNRSRQPGILPTTIEMPRPVQTRIFFAALACLALNPSRTWAQSVRSDSSSVTQEHRQAPSQEEMHARLKKLLANQHADDLALEEYEWVEHQVDQAGGANHRVIEDKTIRLVSNGAGTTKVVLSENGKPTDPAESHRQLQNVAQVLQMMANPNDPRMKAATTKYQKRMHDRAETVDSATDAFLVVWQGQEIRNGRDCDVIQANPNPAFHPHSIFQEALAHVSAKVWVDHATDQVVHAEAQILSDISIGGGLLGKLYRGGTFTLDQAEIAPGIWFSTRYQYDYSGRKFLFPFEDHQVIDASRYRRIGPPAQALALIQNELTQSGGLTDGKPAAGDP
jgi:hypothetical protein